MILNRPNITFSRFLNVNLVLQISFQSLAPLFIVSSGFLVFSAFISICRFLYVHRLLSICRLLSVCWLTDSWVEIRSSTLDTDLSKIWLWRYSNVLNVIFRVLIVFTRGSKMSGWDSSFSPIRVMHVSIFRIPF